MLNDLKNELLNRDRVIENESILAEASGEAPEDKMIENMAALNDGDLSPEEVKECEAVLKNIPEYDEANEDITKEDVKAANTVHEPTIEELAESLTIIE